MNDTTALKCVRVEFYGIARQRTGVGELIIPIACEISLSQLWDQLSAQFPGLGQVDRLDTSTYPTFRVNLDGDRFVSDPSTMIRAGQSVLVLSADAGG